jgi:cysteine desulfurase
MPPRPIYLDYHATTPVDPRVWRAMEPYFTTEFGNPASASHAYGWAASQAVQRARAQVAALIGAAPKEIVFTSGATESDNLAVKGIADRHPSRGRQLGDPRIAGGHPSPEIAARPQPDQREGGLSKRWPSHPGHVITTLIEHHAVLDPCVRLEREGFALTRLGVDRDGRIRLAELEAALRPDTVLVSIMAVNNEVGVIQDMEAIGRMVRAHGAAFHSDATQAVGKLPVDVRRWQVDLLSLSGHKMYGPKGVGALYVRDGLALDCQLDGGGHERGFRSGTLNVPGIVGLGEAAALAQAELEAESARIAALRDRLLERIVSRLDGVSVNGSMTQRVPHNLHLTFHGVEAEALMMSMPELAVSSGSACSSAARSASHVLLALGLSPEQARGSLRFGLGRFTTSDEIDLAADRIVAATRQLRELALP